MKEMKRSIMNLYDDDDIYFDHLSLFGKEFVEVSSGGIINKPFYVHVSISFIIRVYSNDSREIIVETKNTSTRERSEEEPRFRSGG
jgi:hypothetical protein